MAFNFRTEVTCRINDWYHFSSEANDRSPVIGSLEHNLLAAERDFAADLPGPGRLARLGEQLVFQPGYIAFGKSPGFTNRATSRNRHAR